MKKVLSLLLVAVMLCSSFAGLQLNASAEKASSENLPAKNESAQNQELQQISAELESTLLAAQAEGEANRRRHEQERKRFEIEEVETLCPQPSLLAEKTNRKLFNPVGAATADSVSPLVDKCGEDVIYTFIPATGVLLLSGSGVTYDYPSTDSPFSHQSDIRTIIIQPGITGIGSYLFASCSKLESVEIATTVTSIGNFAFWNCDSLTSVVIPDSVRSLGVGAFQNSENLENVLIPASVTELGNSIFWECGKLQTAGPVGSGSNIEFGWSTSIPDGAFQNCNCLKALTLPAGAKSLGESAFSECDMLESVKIPESVQEIGELCFYNCPLLKTAGPVGSGSNIEYGWTKAIPTAAFSYCDALKSVSFPTTLTSLGEGALIYCSSLEEVLLPDSVKSIGASAFQGCESLRHIRIPSSVTTIGDFIFLDCPSLKTAGGIGSGCNLEFAWVGELPREMFNYSLFESIHIPESVTEVGVQAFCYCEQLKELVIPKSVTAIGRLACFQCTALSKLVLQGEPEVGIFAFEGLSLKSAGPLGSGCEFEFGWTKEVPIDACHMWEQLKTVELPEGIVAIRESAFYGCEALETINFPESLTKIEKNAFYGCNKIKSIRLPLATREIGNAAFHEIVSAGPIGSGCQLEFSWKTEIPNNAFCGCEALQTIIFPESLVTIGESAFYGCEALQTIKLPESLATIGKSAFRDCEALKTVDFPKNLTTIGLYAFKGCLNLQKIVFLANNISIGTDAFGGVSVRSAGPIGSGCDLEFAWENVPENAFYGMEKLENVVFPEGIKEIRSDAFYNCKSLTTLEIPDTVDYIWHLVFKNCTALSKVVLKGRITQYGTSIFSGCFNLKTAGPIGSGCDLEFCCQYDPTCDEWHAPDIFGDMKLESIYIPEGTDSVFDISTFHEAEIENLYLPNSLHWIMYACPDFIFEGKLNHLYYYGTKQEADAWDMEYGVKYMWGDDLHIHYLNKSTQPYPSIAQTNQQLRKYDYRAELAKYGDVEQLHRVLEIALKNREEFIGISDITEIPSSLRSLAFIRYYIKTYLQETAAKRGFWYLDVNDSKNGKITELEARYDINDFVVPVIELSEEAQSIANTLLSGLKNNKALTDETKALIVHDRLIRYLEYDHEAANSKDTSRYIKASDVDCVLINQKAICTGYARTYAYLLDQLGIFADVVAAPDLNHAWNLVALNDYDYTMYHVDCTWDDLGEASVGHNNFLRSDAGILKTGHNADFYPILYYWNDYGSLDDTKYDNYAWQNIYSEIQLINNELYYEDESGTLQKLNGSTPKPHQHAFKAVVTAPTCTRQGFTTHTCSCGESYVDSYTSKTGHNVSKKTVVKPTGTSLGYTEHSCSRCGKVQKVDKFTAPTGKLTLKTGARTANALKVTWNNVKTATGYQVQISTKDGKKWSTYANLKAGVTNYTFKKLAAGSNYKLRVRFYIKADDGKNYYSPWSKTLNSTTLPTGTTVTKLTSAKKAFTAQWKKNAAVNGYQIQYGLKSNFKGAKTLTVKNAKTLKATMKSLSAKKTYYVRIRTYKTVSKVNYFSAWSKTYKVKTK